MQASRGWSWRQAWTSGYLQKIYLLKAQFSALSFQGILHPNHLPDMSSKGVACGIFVYLVVKAWVLC